MRKIIPSILITFILVNLFAPFTLDLNNKKTPVKKSVAEADVKDLDVITTASSTENSINFKFKVIRYASSDTHFLIYFLTDKEEIRMKVKDELAKVLPDVDPTQNQASVFQIYAAKAIYEGVLTVNQVYQIPEGTKVVKVGTINTAMSGTKYKEFSEEIKGLEANKDYYLYLAGSSYDNAPDGQDIFVNKVFQAKTAEPGKTLEEEELGRATAGDGYLPSCWLGLTSGGISVSGCLAQLIYALFFKPTSYLFSLAGNFLDWGLDYSVKSSSYDNSFVKEGWGVVRDFVNLFFIFVLLWIAFSTILNIHGFKTKEMIINVVIIGLVMNFSLFITRVIIDASNITARVFYNQNTIKIQDKDGNKPGANADILSSQEAKASGRIRLSELIVSYVNPQKMVLDINRSAVQDPHDITTSNVKVSNGTFILITLLASAVNVIGMIVFLTTGILFIARVIGLWIAMILAPIAFFSYTVPALKNVKMIGWGKWWPNTIQIAFMAPIFVFFMYLIVKFLGTNFMSDILNLKDNQQTGTDFLLLVTVPFAFIIILLNKAKSLAIQFSGDIGSAVTKVGNTVGGLAIGAGVGAAAIGLRQTVGRAANVADKSNWLNDAAAGKRGRFQQFLAKDLGLKTLTNKTARGSFDVRQTSAGNAFSKETGMNLSKGAGFVGLGTKSTVGGYVGAQQRKVEKEKKFGESLGYDHHQYDDLADEIAAKENSLAKFKTQKSWTTKDENGIDVTYERNSSEFKAEVARQEYDVKGLQKKQERVKTGRQMEYALTQRRKSGKIYSVDKTDKEYRKAKEEVDRAKERVEKYPNNARYKEQYEDAKKVFEKKQTYRDDLGNIKKFGHAEKARMHGFVETMKEAGEGFIKGAGIGLAAGSVLPGAGNLGGLLIGGFAGAIRSAALHSGTTNRQAMNKDFHKEEFRDTYTPGSGAPAHHEPAHDDHGGGGHDAGHDDHGGGGHH